MSQNKKKNVVLGAIAAVAIAAALVITYRNMQPPKIEDEPLAGEAEVEIRPNRATAPGFEDEASFDGGDS